MNSIWQAIADFLIKYRVWLLVVLGLLTAYMFSIRGTKISHALTDVIPLNDKEVQIYNKFKQEFGEDGNILITAIEGDFKDLEVFNAMYALAERLKTVPGVQNVISVTNLVDIKVDEEGERFEVKRLVESPLETQEQVDSIFNRIAELPFYEGLLLDKEGESALLGVAIVDTFLNTAKKTVVYDSITYHTEKFEARFANSDADVNLRYAGLPVVRVNVHKTVKVELALFLYMAMAVLAITLFVFFRSLFSVLFPMLVVASVVMWTLGLLGVFDFTITLVTGVIPALITVITIPNCVYLITKYHIEYLRTRDKIKSLKLVIQKIGIVTIMTNATTAVGLGVLAFSEIQPLKEFGIIAGLSVIAAFFISLITIPAVFSFLPAPGPKQLRHLDRKSLDWSIRGLDHIVHNRPGMVYAVSLVLFAISLYGLSLVRPNAYIVDDIPDSSDLIKDLRFVESRYNGALPFEILIDTKRRRGIQRARNLQKIEELQDSLLNNEYYKDKISRSLSVVDLTKFLRQSLYGGEASNYVLPNSDELNFIRSYLANTELDLSSLSKATLFDSTMQKARLTATVKDIGSLKMEELMDSVRSDVASVFGTDSSKYDITITGTTPIFIRGNQYLVNNLITSLAIAFVVIAIIMGLLFRSFKMVVISLIPNFLPLVMVAGVMGYFGIPLKPSTALVFGVAFGIAVDDSIHFLARYRLARSLGDTVSHAVTNSFKDTGVSMIYTSIILFFGFVTFTASSFGGTKALGLLTSMTLGIAMFSNLFLLPVLLLSFDKDTKQTDGAPSDDSPHHDDPKVSQNGSTKELDDLEANNSIETVHDKPAQS